MRVLQHMVFFNLEKCEEKDVAALQEQAQVMAEKCPGIICASFGKAETALYQNYPNRTKGNSFCLLVTFTDVKSCAIYDGHKEHQVFKGMVKPFIREAVTVVDMWQNNFPEFTLYGHTMMSKPGNADPNPGGFVGK